MKLKKTLAVLSAIAAGSTMIFGQAVNAQAEELVPTEEITAPAEEFVAPVENVTEPVEEVIAPVQEVAAPVEETVAPVVEVAAPIEEAAAVTTAVYEEIAPETTVTVVGEEIIVAEEVKDSLGATQTAVAVPVAETTTTTTPLDKTPCNPVDVDTVAGKAQVEDKDIDYNKIYDDFVNNEVIPKTEGGLASLTPAATAQETIKFSENSDEIRVYSELLGVVAATVYDFCQDGIPELITVTHQRLDNGSMAPQSRFIYDLYQYNKATDTIGLLTSTEEFKSKDTYYGDYMYDETYLITPHAAQGGGGEFTLSITGNSLLKDEWCYGRYASYGPFAVSHDYSVYNLDNYKFSKYKVTIGKDRVSQTLPEDYKLGGSTDFELLYYDNAKDPGWGVYNDSPKYSSLNAAAAEITANMKKYGVDMAGVSFGTKEVDFYSYDKEQLDMNIDGLKVEKPIMDYYMSYKNRGDIRMTDYTGLHGKASSAAPKTEAKKDAKKTDSPKTGVAFPIAAAGTGAAAVAFAVLTTLSKKKKD